MNRDSNIYTFLFVGIMIVGIASILAYTSQTLKPMQDENVKNCLLYTSDAADE